MLVKIVVEQHSSLGISSQFDLEERTPPARAKHNAISVGGPDRGRKVAVKCFLRKVGAASVNQVKEPNGEGPRIERSHCSVCAVPGEADTTDAVRLSLDITNLSAGSIEPSQGRTVATLIYQDPCL